MATRTITALFDRYEDASNAVGKLEAAGVPHGDISIVANNTDDRYSGHVRRDADGDDTAAGEGAGTGATLGTVLGGGAGLLAGLGLLAVPGVGPVVAAGWLVATLTGAGVGAATGGLIGSLTGAGLSEDEAHSYAEGLRRGGTLVTARVDDALASRAQSILDEHGSIDMDQRATGWRSEGWTGRTDFDRDPVLGNREVGSTGIGAAATTTTGIGTGAPLPVDDASRGLTGRDRPATDDEFADRSRTYADTTKPVR